MFEFSTKKTIQASAVLLKEHGRRMSRLRLLKMLYMGDRQLLAKIGCRITGDEVYAMDNGPVLSRSYNLIKGEDSDLAIWSRYIRNEGSQDLVLVKDPGVGCLSEFEVDLLKQISAQFREIDDYGVAEFTHEFPEWKKNKPQKNSRKYIPYDDILEALGIQDMKEALLAEAKDAAIVENVIARAAE